jgi:hypothetical protein
MADIEKSLNQLFEVEFNNNPSLFLHKNKGESGYTIGGIYQVANPTMIDWKTIESIVKLVGIKRGSVMLYYDKDTFDKVKSVYKSRYWDGLKLDKVDSQKIASEMFLMGVVSGVKNSTKITQRIIGVKDDGIIGNITLAALNRYNEDDFDIMFDEKEVEYFEHIVENKPDFKRFLSGWKNRAYAV